MDIYNILAGIATFISLLFAINEGYKRRKLEQFTRSSLQGIAGNLAKIGQSTKWAFNNLKGTQNEAVQLPESENKRKIILAVSDGQGDAASSDRMVENLFNEILTLQEGQFGTRIITHPDKDNLELVQKENKQNIRNK